MCEGGRQSREHLFKECRTWKDQIRKLWKKIGELSGEAVLKTDISKGKARGRGKGFGLWGSGGKIRPRNCSIGRLFGDARSTEPILEFLEETDVGKIKKGCTRGRGRVV